MNTKQRFFIHLTLIFCLSLFYSCRTTNQDIFQIRLVHPENENITKEKSQFQLEEYERFNREPPDWPRTVWVNKKVEMTISDIELVSIKLNKGIFPPGTPKSVLEKLKTEHPEMDPKTIEYLVYGGQPSIEITFTQEGQKKFTSLTSNSLNRRTAIFIEGELRTAPAIDGPIPGNKVGFFLDLPINELKKLVERMNNQIQRQKL